MNSDHVLKRITSIGSFSSRELGILCNFDRKKAWQLLSRLRKWNIVKPRTRKNSVVFWEIMDFKSFKEELERSME